MLSYKATTLGEAITISSGNSGLISSSGSGKAASTGDEDSFESLFNLTSGKFQPSAFEDSALSWLLWIKT